MTEEQLERANKKKSEISKLQTYLNKCDAQICDTIIFTYGNGSDRSIVCTSSRIIELVKELIIKEPNSDLQKLKEEFSNI